MEKVIINYHMTDNENDITCKTVGNLTQMDNYLMLEFKEKDTNVKAVYKIYDERFVVERIGDAVMQMSFIDQKVTKGSIKSDFGCNIDFHVRTLNYTFKENRIDLQYRLDIEDNNIHSLQLEYAFKKN